MTTIRQLITGAMRLNRIVAANETPTDSDMQVGVDALASMLDSMQTDFLNIYTINPQRFLLEAGKQAYTLGPAIDNAGNLTGADWITERPVRIEKAVILQYPSVVYPVDPTPPPAPGITFSLTGTTGIILRSAESQMTDFTDWTPPNEALSATANDWDLFNLPTGSVVSSETFLVPGENWAVRSVSNFSGTDINRIAYCELVYTETLPNDIWFGVITNGTEAAIDPAPAVLTFDPNAGITASTAGGQYYALYNPATGEIRNSAGDTVASVTASAGDVIGLRYDNLGSGTPVLNCDLEIYINGVFQGNIPVPHSCFDTTRGNITAAVVRGTI